MSVPTSFDESPVAVERQRRFARLAVAWFGVDADRVEEVLRAVLKRCDAGEEADLLEELSKASILTPEQAKSLRIGQAPTQVQESPPASEKPRDRLAATAPIMVPLAEGATLNDEPTQMGPYRILRLLGIGGMGAVYLAFDKTGNRQVAVKVLSAENAPRQGILRRFQLEGQHGAMLQHPNIVRSYDSGQDTASGLHYIVLEYVEGPTAHELLDQKGKLEVGDAVHIVLDIARALEHAHKSRIIHRDIKPGNILLAPSGLAKLTDLGLAKRHGDTHKLTHHSQGIGTPYYMPYEQAMNARMADERSDIYALGATLFHLLTGEVPFPGETSLEVVEKKAQGTYPPAQSFNPLVPDNLEAILAQMLGRNPEDRYQTVSEVIVDLERANLAAAVPSYATLDSALRDPVMRKRLTAPVETTQPDLRLQQEREPDLDQASAWIVRYRDARGQACKLKAKAVDIISRLKAGTIPLDAEGHPGDGRFAPLARQADFEKTIAALRAQRTAKRKAKSVSQPARLRAGLPLSWLMLAAFLGLGVLFVMAMTAYLLWRGT
jgi:serine/threonine protein kinase